MFWGNYYHPQQVDTQKEIIFSSVDAYWAEIQILSVCLSLKTLQKIPEKGTTKSCSICNNYIIQTT